MPIYAYKCSACGHQQDVLQKLSDPLLTVCPACGQSTYSKQVTAAGFQLKGSGWYVTDFRNNGSKPDAGGAKDKGASAGKDESGQAAGGDSAAASADKPASTDKPAPADKPAAAAPPAAPAAPASSGS